MERLTISMSDAFAAELAAFMGEHGYDNRSEAVRDLARQGLQHARATAGHSGPCVATLLYVYDHHRRDLSQRLTDRHHDGQALQVATLHVHLDHHNCLEVSVLRGDAEAVRGFARGVIAERGVVHGQLELFPLPLPGSRSAGHPEAGHDHHDPHGPARQP